MPEGSLSYNPLPTQQLFHESPAKIRVYFGGFGSGKTLCGCVEALMQSVEYPGNEGVIGRYTYQRLTDTTQATFFDVCPAEIIKKFYRAENYVLLTNGSRIMFRHLENEEQFRSMNLGWFYIDEATECNETTFLTLLGRLRRPNASRRCWMTTNTAGHDWMWKHFVATPMPQSHYFVAKSRENPYLPPEYIDQLEQAYPKEWVARFLEADFNIFEGQIFYQFYPPKHVKERLVAPEGSVHFRMIDHGLRNPTCCLWGAVTPTDELYILNEYYEQGHTIAQNAHRIKMHALSNKAVYTVIDPSAKAMQPIEMRSIIEEYAKHEIFCTPGNRNVESGIAQMQQLFASDKILIDSKCINLIAELQAYQWKHLQPDKFGEVREIPRKQDDHAVDALRYGVMSRPWPTAIVPAPQLDRMEQWWKEVDRRIQEGAGKPVHPILGAEY